MVKKYYYASLNFTEPGELKVFEHRGSDCFVFEFLAELQLPMASVYAKNAENVVAIHDSRIFESTNSDEDNYFTGTDTENTAHSGNCDSNGLVELEKSFKLGNVGDNENEPLFVKRKYNFISSSVGS